jgi:23S rRNA pseudouridine1911/1915/1917 synthase
MPAHRVHAAAPVRLVDYAKAHLVVVPVAEVGALVARGAIAVNGRAGTTRDMVRDADVISVTDADWRAARPIPPQPIELRVLHEDADVLVVDKPGGMHVHPLGAYRTDTLLNALLWRCGARDDEPWGAWRPAAAHRLDRAASGLVMIAKHAAAHDALRVQLARGEVTRRYLAIVDGQPRADAGTIDTPLGRDPRFSYRRAVVADGQPAVTHWRVLARRGDRCELAVELATGRTHQIRAHLASIGHPIAGDTLYAAATGVHADSALRIALHACELHVGAIVCHAPPPADFVTEDYPA